MPLAYPSKHLFSSVVNLAQLGSPRLALPDKIIFHIVQKLFCGDVRHSWWVDFWIAHKIFEHENFGRGVLDM